MKILEQSIGDVRGVVYQYQDGYSYKVYQKKERKGTVVAQSYVYFLNKDECIDRMQSDIHQILGIVKDLLNFDKIWYNISMSEDNIVKIVVALIALSGTILGLIIGMVTKSRKEAVKDAIREQQEKDCLDKIFEEMKGIKTRLDIHNGYAEKFGDIEVHLASMAKDIEYLKSRWLI